MDVAKVKEQARAGWSKGEYAGLSEMLRPAAVALADACAVSAGQEVLDVAAGDGNFAVACAARGSERGGHATSRRGWWSRAGGAPRSEGYDIEWVEADAEELPFEDERFDCVGSVFGAMLTPQPRVVAEEMFRVVRPGNTVGMTAWLPEGPTFEMFKLGRELRAAGTRRRPPPGAVGRRGHGARAPGRAGQLDRDRARGAAVERRLARGVHGRHGAPLTR